MARPYLVADLFCGAGGSSTGARRALERRGRRMRLVAVNHWDVAIATHSANHPEADHLCSNVYQLAPREAVPGGRLDLLMASPTCTFHSRARGGKPISREQRYGRMTPTQVVRWVTELDVENLLVENVPEFVDWGPVHRDVKPVNKRCLRARCRAGRPCKASRGKYFRAWVRKLERLGYQVGWRVLNAADYGDVTTRRRFFLIGRRRGPVVWPEPTHSRDGSGDMFGEARARWRPAREVIDWSLPGRSIFRRKRPLSPKTLARIYAGAVRFRWPEPYLVVLRRHMDAQSLDEPLPTITAGGTHLGVAQPLVTRTDMHKSNALCVRSAEEPLATITTGGGMAVVRPFFLPQRSDREPTRTPDDPLPTLTAVARVGMVQPFVVPQHGGGAPRSTDRPVPTVTTDGAHALVTPYYGQSGCKPTSEPLPTVTTRDRFGLVMPVTHHDGSQRARGLDVPLPTVTGARRGELAFVTPAFGEREGQRARVHSVERPVPTICATGRLNLVQAQARGQVDILFRMLQPSELAAAMGFGAGYEFRGNKTEITRQIGNAVPVRTAEALVGAVLGGTNG